MKMLIEIYKGIEIFHDPEKDVFTTNIMEFKNPVNERKDEYISAPRLQRTRDAIDRYLNTADQKPVLEKAWLQETKNSYRNNAPYQLVTIIRKNTISNQIFVEDENGKLISVPKPLYNSTPPLFIFCEENNETINQIRKLDEEIDRANTLISSLAKQLIPLSKEHFKK